MVRYLIKIALIIITFVTLVAALSDMAIAANPTIAPPITPPSIDSGSNSGSSSGGTASSSSYSYSAPVFQTYTDPLKSSDGSVIGSLEGKDFNSVMVHAEKNATAGNLTYDLVVDGELSSKPSDNCWLDISFPEPSSSALPPGMNGVSMLCALNVTKNPASWSYKSGSPKYTLTISGLNGSLNLDEPYYLVRSDGSGYQVQKLSVNVSGDQASVTFNPPGDTGIFTIISVPIATPTPTPTPTPVSTPTPTPLPVGSGIWGFPVFLALFVLGVIAGAAALYILNIHR